VNVTGSISHAILAGRVHREGDILGEILQGTEVIA
jgi:hypothetical protein